MVFTIATYELTNDQFGRISPGWQLARFGDVPFRDFLDPGYFLTELTTAALQRLLGEQLLGEMLLDAVFIATGAVLVLRLSYQASRSTIIACTARETLCGSALLCQWRDSFATTTAFSSAARRLSH